MQAQTLSRAVHFYFWTSRKAAAAPPTLSDSRENFSRSHRISSDSNSSFNLPHSDFNQLNVENDIHSQGEDMDGTLYIRHFFLWPCVFALQCSLINHFSGFLCVRWNISRSNYLSISVQIQLWYICLGQVFSVVAGSKLSELKQLVASPHPPVEQASLLPSNKYRDLFQSVTILFVLFKCNLNFLSCLSPAVFLWRHAALWTALPWMVLYG